MFRSIFISHNKFPFKFVNRNTICLTAALFFSSKVALSFSVCKQHFCFDKKKIKTNFTKCTYRVVTPPVSTYELIDLRTVNSNRPAPQCQPSAIERSLDSSVYTILVGVYSVRSILPLESCYLKASTRFFCTYYSGLTLVVYTTMNVATPRLSLACSRYETKILIGTFKL